LVEICIAPAGKSSYPQIAKSPNRQIVKSSNRQIVKSPNRQIAKSSNRHISPARENNMVARDEIPGKRAEETGFPTLKFGIFE